MVEQDKIATSVTNAHQARASTPSSHTCGRHAQLHQAVLPLFL
ncbi:hypothetical protein HMPREF9248_0861 [Fannyhessea vaginae PB189-T1-4]|uniref:Uncharacterized protein n=1 Tax=Fannyhessea vaginae PB189-T1-4 TaxID=866774 RepID=A0ABN0AZP7_9ACTN|nr:hypothetical protein HMPREF9248_0861 [Fannyhessea vaginae PB189-T1-4]